MTTAEKPLNPKDTESKDEAKDANKESAAAAPSVSIEGREEMRELASAMNNLAEALKETNALITEARREDPKWKDMATTIADIARQLRMISVKL